MPWHKGYEEPEDDLEQDIRSFSIRVGIVLHELVDA